MKSKDNFNKTEDILFIIVFSIMIFAPIISFIMGYFQL